MAKDRGQLIEALALLSELAFRLLGMRPYEVQLIGVLAMYDGHIVQLAPGEGKTLTIGLLGVLQGWDVRPCHILTANDYLAQRDAEEMAPLYDFCDVRVGAVNASLNVEQKMQQYTCDVVYATAKQVLADFLTDRIVFDGPINRNSLNLRALYGQHDNNLIMRGLYSVIVDEADNILIDEAITPMIISRPEVDAVLHEAVMVAQEKVEGLQSNVHYTLDLVHRDVRWLDTGDNLLEQFKACLPSVWRGRQQRQDLFSQAVLARDYFQCDKHYVLLDGQVVIVDESTGRTMPGRTWSYGLHQAIEARAGVALTDPSRTLARLSFQNFFKKYYRLCGASGTLQSIPHELYFNYRAHTLRVPSRLASKLTVHDFCFLPDVSTRLNAIVNQTQLLHDAEIPVLIGTRTIQQSELLSAVLKDAGIPHELLNAKQHEKEAGIIADAGLPGRVTVATNMAGRGTDIKLPASVLKRGGLRVLMLEPHESDRVDWQLFGRAGRQGEMGEVFAYVTPQDEVFQKALPWLGRQLLFMLPQSFLQRHVKWLIKLAQGRAQMRAFRMRRMMNHMTRESRKNMTFIRDE